MPRSRSPCSCTSDGAVRSAGAKSVFNAFESIVLHLQQASIATRASRRPQQEKVRAASAWRGAGRVGFHCGGT